MSTVDPRDPTLDPSVVERLRQLGGDTLLAQLNGMFATAGPQRVAEIRDALAARQAEPLGRAAHALRSTAGNVGAAELVRLCGELEERAIRVADGLFDADGRRLVDELAVECEAVGRELAAQTDSDVAEDAEPESERQRPRLLLIEDNPDNRLLVRLMLEDENEIREYEDGVAGLAGIEADRPDLVLLDISLPGMDGTEVLQNIRADQRFEQLPVVALTAHAMVGDRERFLAMGFSDYISKPILDEDELLAIVRRWA